MAAARKKRPACYPECTKHERLKRYKQERANLGELNRLLRNEPRRLATVHASAKQPEIPPLQAPKSSPVSSDVEDGDEDDDALSLYSEASDMKMCGNSEATFCIGHLKPHVSMSS